MSAYTRIKSRDTATLRPSPLPEHYEFLKAPSPRRKYRINFRHPAYAPDDNLLFTLYAWDMLMAESTMGWHTVLVQYSQTIGLMVI